jgi:HEPN domain-containing protein
LDILEIDGVKQMTPEEKFAYWLEHAQYDKETADSMAVTGRWYYVVFMCQQAVEKLVKGLYTLYIDDNVPRLHSIRSIVEKFESKLQTPFTQEQYQFFDTLSGFYLGNRYPDFIQNLITQITEDTAKNVLTETKKVFTWLLTLKP